MSGGPRVTGIDDIRLHDMVAEARHWSHRSDRAREVGTSMAEHALTVAEQLDHDEVSGLVRTTQLACWAPDSRRPVPRLVS